MSHPAEGDRVVHRLSANPWVQRALLMFVVATTLGPLAVARASTDSSGWSGLFDFLLIFWLVEIVAALAGALLIRLLEDARKQASKQKGSRTSRAVLLVARLAFWGSLLLSFALPCAIAWVWMLAFAQLSS